jgi:hypothetical protein
MTDVPVYLALSISGSNTFIIASRTLNNVSSPNRGDTLDIAGRQFKVIMGRGTGVKLHLPDLEGSGQATSGVGPDAINDPIKVFSTFQLLRGEGWKVEDAKFISKHKTALVQAGLVDNRGKHVSTLEQGLPKSEALSPEQELESTKSPEIVEPLPAADIIEQLAKEQSTAQTEHLSEADKDEKKKPVLIAAIGPRQEKMLNIIKAETLPVSFSVVKNKYEIKLTPSDFQRIINGLVQRKRIEVDGQSITKVN